MSVFIEYSNYIPQIQLDVINVLIIVFSLTILMSGVVIYLRNRKSTTNKLYLVAVVPIFLWMLSMLFFRSTTSSAAASFWAQFLYFFPPLIPLSFIYLMKAFPDKNARFNTLEFIIFLLPLIYITYICFAQNGLITQATPITAGENIIEFSATPYYLYSFAIFVYWSIAFYILYKKYKNYQDSKGKRAIKIFFTGTLISTTIAIIGNLVLPYFGYFALNWTGQIGIIVMIGFILYGIVNHQLFNVKVITTELFTFFIWIILLINAIGAQDLQEGIVDWALLGFLTLFGTLLIRSIRKEIKTRERLEKVTKNLKHANTKLKKMDQQKSQMLSIASHQFRSPLTAIKGYASMLADGTYGKIPEKMQEPISRILESSSNLANIVNDFLNISRIERGRMEYNFEIADLTDIAQKAVDEAQPTTGDKIDLSIKCDTQKSFTAKMDVGKIRQVVGNLIDNAIKYTPKGSVTVRVKKVNNESKIRLAVEDTGVGISKEDQMKIFKQFRRAKNANNVNVMGTGLGLYVAKKIIQAHDGRIWVESDGKGKGSTFFFELDAVDANAENSKQKDSKEI